MYRSSFSPASYKVRLPRPPPQRPHYRRVEPPQRVRQLRPRRPLRPPPPHADRHGHDECRASHDGHPLPRVPARHQRGRVSRHDHGTCLRVYVSLD